MEHGTQIVLKKQHCATNKTTNAWGSWVCAPKKSSRTANLGSYRIADLVAHGRSMTWALIVTVPDCLGRSVWTNDQDMGGGVQSLRYVSVIKYKKLVEVLNLPELLQSKVFFLFSF